MGLSSVVGLLALVSVTLATTSDNNLDVGERVVLVSPVLAPPKESNFHSKERARQFPVLVLLAQQHPENLPRSEQAAKSLEVNPQPVFVKNLKEQYRPEASRSNRQKRHHHLATKLLGHGLGFGGTFGYSGGYSGGYGGGGGGYGGGGGGYGGGGYGNGGYGHGGYVEAPKTVVVKVVKEYEVGHHGGGGYNGGGGYGGGGGGGFGGGGGYGGGYGGGGGGGYGGGYGGGGGGGGGGNGGFVHQPSGGGGGCNTCGGGGGGGNGYSQASATATATATASANSNSYGKR